MQKRSGIVAVAALGTMLFAASVLGGASATAAATASPTSLSSPTSPSLPTPPATPTSSPAPTSPATPSPQPPTSCHPVYFTVEFGQGVDVFCDQAPNTYQVVAQCDNGSDFWTSTGTLTVANSAPSIAVCRGNLLAPAQVISYFVTE